MNYPSNSELLASIRDKYVTLDRCKEHDCHLKTNDMNRVILDSEKHRVDTNVNMCVCIVFVDQGSIIIAVCELKSGAYRIEDVKKQLEGGITLAEKYVQIISSLLSL